MTVAEPDMMEYRMSKVEQAFETIADNLQKLTQLEMQHQETRDALVRAFKAIDANRDDYERSCEKVDQRLRAVELQLPILKLASRWVIGGTISVVSGVFATFGVILWALLPIIMGGH